MGGLKMAIWGYHVILLISLLIFQLTTTLPQVTGSSEQADERHEEKTEDAMISVMDSILLDLTTTYDQIKTDDFWHPYDLATGNDNREGEYCKKYCV